MLAKRYNTLVYFGQGCFLAYYVIAFRQAGLPLAVIAVANSLFDITSVVCELPTSVLFDKWSGRRIMIMGAAARLAGFMCFLVDSSNLGLVVAGELLTGFGSSTETGAASALYVAEQEAREREEGYATRTETKLAELGEAVGLSVIAGGVVGALLYAVSPSLIWVGAGAAYLLAIVTLARMPEMTVAHDEATSLRSLMRDMRRAVAGGVRVPECWMVVALDVGAMSMAMLWPLLLGNDYGTMWLQLIGLVAMNGGSALAGRLGRRFESTPGRIVLYLFVDAVGQRRGVAGRVLRARVRARSGDERVLRQGVRAGRARRARVRDVGRFAAGHPVHRDPAAVGRSAWPVASVACSDAHDAGAARSDDPRARRAPSSVLKPSTACGRRGGESRR